MPNPRMCPHCRAFIDPKERVCPYCDGELGGAAARRAEPEAALRGLVPSTHLTTFILLAVNFGLFAAMMILSRKIGSGDAFGVDIRVLDVFGAKERYAIRVEGQWWRLITAGFLHAGILHILMNSWVLFDLGAQVEHVFGTARFLVIYFVSSAFGFWLSLWLTAGLSTGASAALCGLIGAMMAYAKRTGQSFVWSFYLRWILFIIVIGVLIPFIDNAAHIGGFIAGFAIGYAAGSQRINRETEQAWNALAGVVGVAVALSMGLAYLQISSAL